jgi:hypothetical protein
MLSCILFGAVSITIEPSFNKGEKTDCFFFWRISSGCLYRFKVFSTYNFACTLGNWKGWMNILIVAFVSALNDQLNRLQAVYGEYS